MIKLNSDTFRRAITKAQTVAPACSLLQTDEVNFTFSVARSGGGASIVDIWHQGGTLWTSCDCAAGVGLHRRGNPQPCYHVAQAALSIGLLPQAMPIGAALDLKPEGAISRRVPPQLVPLGELSEVSTPTPQPRASQGPVITALTRTARLIGRVFWFAREARA